MFINIIRHVLSRGSAILINQLSVLIAIPILAARLDFFIFGQVTIGFVLVQLSWVVSDWGVQHFSIENWTRAKTLHDKNRFISLLLTLRLSVAILCLLIILFLIQVNLLNFPLLFWISIIPSILMGGAYPLWFFQVNKIPQTMILPTFMSRLVYLLVIYFLVNDNSSAYWAFLAQGINMGAITLYAYWHMMMRHSYSWINFKKKQFTLVIRSSFPYLLNAVTNNQINTLWGFGLAVVGGPMAMAIFNLGDQIYRMGSALTNVIAQSVRIYSKESSFDKTLPSVLFFISIYLMLAFIVIFFAKDIVMKLFSEDYYDAIKLIQIMTIIWALHAIIKILNYPILGKFFSTHFINRLTFKFLILHVFIFLVWINLYNSPLTMSYFFGCVVLIHLITFIYLVYLKVYLKK
jgi:O-antigen/teichoic acid export membrane protein